jgi:hypothetical protein
MYTLQVYELEVAAELSGGLQGAITIAMVPILAPVIASVRNLEIRALNAKIGPGGIITMPLKALPGHSGAGPFDPALVALTASGSIKVGTKLPTLAFPQGGLWTRAGVMGLTAIQLNDLSWYYHEPFAGTSPGVASRRDSFAAFLGI